MKIFSEKVFNLVKKIPRGKITTYKEIARALDTKAYRVIGNILAKNENSFLDGGNIPCQRVIRSDGNVGGFCGKKCGKMVCEKKKLLQKEGIKFNKQNKVVDFENKLFRL
jgi:methylated-DNA-[protein]-cysteine S-methyltransferase